MAAIYSTAAGQETILSFDPYSPFGIAKTVGGLTPQIKADLKALPASDFGGLDGKSRIVQFIDNPWAPVLSAQDLVYFYAAKKSAESGAVTASGDSSGGIVGNNTFDDGASETKYIFEDVIPGGDIASKAIEGLAIFLADRAKAELTSLYLDQLKEHLDKAIDVGGEKPITLSEIFPSAYVVLFDVEKALSPQFGPTLKRAFEKDLGSLVENVDRYVIPDRTKAKPEYTLAIAGYYAATGMLAGHQPTSVLRDLHERTKSDKYSPFTAAISVLYHLSESTRFGGSWIPTREVALLNPVQWNYFVRLVYARDPDAFKAIGFEESQISTDATKVGQFVTDARDLIQSLAEWRDSMDSVANAGPTPATAKSAILVEADNDGNPEKAKSQTDTAEQLVRQKTKAYVASFQNVLETSLRLTNSTSTTQEDIHKTLKAAMTFTDVAMYVHAGQYDKIVPELWSGFQIMQIDTLAASRPILRYGALAADISMAKDPTQVASIIEDAALPQGSARQKNSLGGLYLNSYVGMSCGLEWLESENGSSGHVSAFAPVGFEYCFGRVSMFMSVMDLGALVSYRTKETVDTAEDDPVETTVDQSSNVEFAQVFAPGAFLTVRPFTNPLAFIVGAQLAPNLRTVRKSTVGVPELDVRDQMAVRFTIAVAVDIPLMRF